MYSSLLSKVNRRLVLDLSILLRRNGGFLRCVSVAEFWSHTMSCTHTFSFSLPVYFQKPRNGFKMSLVTTVVCSTHICMYISFAVLFSNRHFNWNGDFLFHFSGLTAEWQCNLQYGVEDSDEADTKKSNTDIFR